MSENLEDTLRALAEAAKTAAEDSKQRLLEVIDCYISSAGEKPADEFDALQALQGAVRRLLLDASKKQFIAHAIDVRLAEVTAAMAGNRRPVLRSDLINDGGV
jgi:hypothetical protein